MVGPKTDRLGWLRFSVRGKAICRWVPFAVLTFLLTTAEGATFPNLRLPVPGSYSLRVLSPNVLDIEHINSMASDATRVDSWDWVNDQDVFAPPDLSSIQVTVNGQPDSVAKVGFKRRPVYAPLVPWDLRIGNHLYLELDQPVAEGDSVEVVNDGTLWPTDTSLTTTADPLRYSPAIHVNQEGYMPDYPKIARVGYYLGDLGELPIPSNHFMLVDTQSGATVYEGTLDLHPDYGYTYSPLPYQNVYQADFTYFSTPGEYRIVVPGLGGSTPFRIDDGVAMDFARTFELGMFHQRSGFNVALPFTRFTHAADHTDPAAVPVDVSAPFQFTWTTISNYATQVNPDNPTQTAPPMTSPDAQLYPFVNPGLVQVSGGHFEAGDYNRVTYNAAELIHVLMFAADSLPGVARLDNLGIPESGDGVCDLLQEAKWEADFLAKLQDADGGFYYSVYPQFREYENDVLPENGDPQVVWPKNTVSTAAAVAALAQCASSPAFKSAYPQAASNYWAKAQLGWQFLTNAIAEHGLDGAYQEIQHFGDDFADHDELAWAACEMFLATGDPQFQQKLFDWFPDPTDPATFRWGWVRMYACYGDAVRDYAFAVKSGRLSADQIDSNYLSKCITVITNCGNDKLSWSQNDAYGTSFPPLDKAYRGGGWYFSSEQIFDMAVAYQFDPKPAYLDAILANLNYAGGCNPVNVTLVTGLGWKRQRNIVDQYSVNDWRALPKDGIPIGNIIAEFFNTWTYGSVLHTLPYPSDYADVAPYANYDRWCDDWNVSTEASTTDTARALAGVAWLAAQTPVALQSWRSMDASIVANTAGYSSGQPITASLQLPTTNLTGAKIVWEPHGLQPAFGGVDYTFTPNSGTNSQWIEAEVQWPDGRRAFAANSIDLTSVPVPKLSDPQAISGAGFSFQLTGVPGSKYVVEASTDLSHWQPVATNTLPASGTMQISDSETGNFPARYYRVVPEP